MLTILRPGALTTHPGATGRASCTALFRGSLRGLSGHGGMVALGTGAVAPRATEAPRWWPETQVWWIADDSTPPGAALRGRPLGPLGTFAGVDLVVAHGRR